MYQQVRISDLALVGLAGAVPDAFAGLDDATLAELSWVGEPLHAVYAGTGFWRVLVADPAYDPATEILTETLVLRKPHAGSRTVPAVRAKQAKPPPSVADLLAASTAAFKARRDGGFTLAGMQIATDEESRGLIDGAYSLSERRPGHVFDFRAVGGWANLDAATIETIADAVGMWVQACYSARRQVEAGIADGSIATEAAVRAVYAAVALPE